MVASTTEMNAATLKYGLIVYNTNDYQHGDFFLGNITVLNFPRLPPTAIWSLACRNKQLTYNSKHSRPIPVVMMASIHLASLTKSQHQIRQNGGLPVNLPTKQLAVSLFVDHSTC